MRKYRKVHVLKYRKVLKQFCANKKKKPRKNAENAEKNSRIGRKEEIRRNAENFHVCKFLLYKVAQWVMIDIYIGMSIRHENFEVKLTTIPQIPSP